jgi:hypothetical protein
MDALEQACRDVLCRHCVTREVALVRSRKEIEQRLEQLRKELDKSPNAKTHPNIELILALEWVLFKREQI